MLEIVTLVLGPVETNAYLVADTESGDAVVVDPAWDGAFIVEHAVQRGWQIRQFWLTHAHFDHFGGAAGLAKPGDQPPQGALHPLDLSLWQAQGGAPLFGLHIDPGPRPEIALEHGQKLHVGEFTFEVRHAPGHTPGHVVFYCPARGVVFCGDVIFQGSIGRTDLPGGNYRTLIESIRTQILSLPDETLLFSGHGPETTVGDERATNPFLV
jgi:hydroxyacylglutathione hydrolase